jgi:hypothetical protein
MLRKRRKLLDRRRHVMARLERKLAHLKVQVAVLMQNPDSDLAVQDHFTVWQRPPLFDHPRNSGLH